MARLRPSNSGGEQRGSRRFVNGGRASSLRSTRTAVAGSADGILYPGPVPPRRPAVTASPDAVLGRLAVFVGAWQHADPHEALLHDAKRLLLNQLKASAEASQQPAGRQMLAQAAGAPRSSASARLWWSNVVTTPAQAAAVHTQLLCLLPFGDTHLPTLGNFTAALLPDVLAQAEAGHHDGMRVLTALLVGLEVAIGVATLVNAPRHAAAAPRLGAAAARCVLRGLDGAAALDALQADWPDWLQADKAVPDGLEQFSGVKGIALHCRPLPVAALAPVEAVLVLRAQAGHRTLQRLELALSPRAARLVLRDEALRDCLAAAWLLGQFSTDEGQPACRQHPATVALRERIELQVDDGIAGLDACRMSAAFADGSCEHGRIDAFLGAPGQPLSDAQLSELFRSAASDVVLPRRAGEILQAVWGLERAADAGRLLGLLRPQA